ncbi:NifB/NifX family molybdenum-iron cluster-binding protein [Myxococcota bacterium]
MRVAFPSQDDRGLESPVYGHFGSAPHFVVVETGTGACIRVVNRDREHLHGQCRPISAFGEEPVDAVVVGGIGGGAIRKLNAAGIKVYRAVEGSVQENLDLFKSGQLPEFTLEQACAGHQTNGECAH